MNNVNFVSFSGNGESAGVPAYATEVKKSQCPPNQPNCDTVNFRANGYNEPEKKNTVLKWGIGLASAAALAIGGLGYVRKAKLISKMSDGWLKDTVKKAEPLTESCYKLCSKVKTTTVECMDKVKKFFTKD